MVQILSRNEIESVDWGEDMDDFTARGPDHRTWHRFGVLSSGEYLAINLEGSLVRVADKERNRGRVFSLFHPICVYSEATRGVKGKNPVIALSFTELLTRLLADSNVTPLHWQSPDFEAHADAEQFTRRTRRFKPHGNLRNRKSER
ncbi:MAG: hypothetical protein JJ992_23095 [Planctomycetes bacterium]|nr:hypothetical protein [Planctomycetota bacterium]